MADSKNQSIDVREVQTYLRRIADEYPRIPLLAVDGIYGEKTTEAVRIFQELFGLPVTGDVDSATWDALVEEYTRLTYLTSPPQPIRPFMSGDQLSAGDEGNTVRILQAMLNTITSYYNNLLTVSCDGRFDTKTIAAIKQLQHIFGVEQTGTVNRQTWDMLACTYNAYVGR